MMRAGNRGFAPRGGARFAQEPKVLIICEDKKSGKLYLEDAKMHFRVQADVRVSHCGKTDPKNIVLEALKNEAKFEKIFCVIDRDTHETFDEAVNLAEGSAKVELVVSYPCFEFWLLLHFGYVRRPFVRAGNKSAGELVCAELKAKENMGGYTKGAVEGLFKSMLEGNKFQDARRLSPKVLQEANDSGEMNPSTRLHELFCYFEEMQKPKPLPS